MPEKHTTIRDNKRLLWYTQRLWIESADLVPFDIKIADVQELDWNCWFDSREPTLREVARHARRIQDADLQYPIILNDDGSLMDGGHRLCKALLEGRDTIQAVQFSTMPEPDEVMEVEMERGT